MDTYTTPDGSFTLDEGESVGCVALSDAGCKAVASLRGSGHVTYGGVVGGHHVFRHGSGDYFEPAGRVGPALAAKREAEERFEAAVVAAHAAGEPIARIARDAGMSREGVYKLLRRRGAA